MTLSACGAAATSNVAQAPAGTANIAAATTATDDAGSIPTIDFTERMPTMPPIPTQELGPSPVELVRRIDVPSPNLGGMALDREGNIYVSSKNEGQILKYSPEGELLLTWGALEDQLVEIYTMAVDDRGEVYLSAADNYIRVFDSGGKFLRKWGGTGVGNGQFNGPAVPAFDKLGNLYITDWRNQRVQKFDANGKFLLKWGSPGSDDGQFEAPGGVVVDTRGNVYVSDHEQGSVQKFDSNGKFLLKWGIDPGVVSAVDSHGNVYVADTEGHRIQVFDPNGKFLEQWDHTGEEPFVYPEGVAIDSKGYFYVREDSHERDARIYIFRRRN